MRCFEFLFLAISLKHVVYICISLSLRVHCDSFCEVSNETGKAASVASMHCRPPGENVLVTNSSGVWKACIVEIYRSVPFVQFCVAVFGERASREPFQPRNAFLYEPIFIFVFVLRFVRVRLDSVREISLSLHLPTQTEGCHQLTGRFSPTFAAILQSSLYESRLRCQGGSACE